MEETFISRCEHHAQRWESHENRQLELRLTQIFKVFETKSHSVGRGSDLGDSQLSSTIKVTARSRICASDPFGDRRLVHLTMSDRNYLELRCDLLLAIFHPSYNPHTAHVVTIPSHKLSRCAVFSEAGSGWQMIEATSLRRSERRRTLRSVNSAG